MSGRNTREEIILQYKASNKEAEGESGRNRRCFGRRGKIFGRLRNKFSVTKVEEWRTRNRRGMGLAEEVGEENILMILTLERRRKMS